MSNRAVIVLILAAAIAAAGGLWLGQRYSATIPAEAAPALQAGLLYPEPRAIAPFTLTRADGSTFSERDLKGRWSLLFFGFTHCPDVCPVTLAAMRALEQQIAARTDGTPQPQLVFVSVDPARDRGAVMGDYARYFSPAIIAVTAEDAALRDLTGRLGIVYMNSPLPDGGYTVDHSSQLLLVDPDGRLAGMFRPPLDAARIAADIASLSGKRAP